MKEMKRINSQYFKVLAIFLFIAWLICLILRNTSLMQNYYINLITLLVVNNTINIFVIIIPLMTIYIIDKKRKQKEGQLKGEDDK